MEANKILHSNVLDIVFDGRNKEYGAYELRPFQDHGLHGCRHLEFCMISRYEAHMTPR